MDQPPKHLWDYERQEQGHQEVFLPVRYRTIPLQLQRTATLQIIGVTPELSTKDNTSFRGAIKEALTDMNEALY